MPPWRIMLSHAESQTQRFSYDERDRLTHAWPTGSNSLSYDETYTYSRIGNLTSKAGVSYNYPVRATHGRTP